MREIKAYLMDTVERGISITRVKECREMIINMHQPHENVQEEREVCAMDSDDELALYEEIDAMTEALERTEAARKTWELVAAKHFNQVHACMCVCVRERVCVRVHIHACTFVCVTLYAHNAQLTHEDGVCAGVCL